MGSKSVFIDILIWQISINLHQQRLKKIDIIKINYKIIKISIQYITQLIFTKKCS